MLQIRQAQFDVFRQHMENKSVDRLTQQLEEEFPQRLAEPKAARHQAELTIRKANEAHVESDGSIMELGRLMMRFGNDLEAFPDPLWAGAILSHAALPGDLKIDFLRQRLEPRIETGDEEA